MIIVCCACKTEMRRDDVDGGIDGIDTISHGYCHGCAERLFEEYEQSPSVEQIEEG